MNKSSVGTCLLVVRHPEHELRYEVFGEEPTLIEMDLGAGFDITHPRDEDRDDVIEWVEGIRDSVDAFDFEPDDPFVLAIEHQLVEVLEAYGLVDFYDEEDGTNTILPAADVAAMAETDDEDVPHASD
jgi:hypothetical protein